MKTHGRYILDMLRLRPATAADAPDVARVHVRSWQAGYRGLLPDAYLDGLRPEERVDRYTFGDPDPQRPYTTVALVDAAIVGFVTVGPASEETGGAGHLMALYVDPDHFRRGIGRSLLREGRRLLAQRGHDSAVLWMLAGNRAAAALYLGDGWVAQGAPEIQQVWGQALTSQRYRRGLP